MSSARRWTSEACFLFYELPRSKKVWSFVRRASLQGECSCRVRRGLCVVPLMQACVVHVQETFLDHGNGWLLNPAPSTLTGSFMVSHTGTGTRYLRSVVQHCSSSACADASSLVRSSIEAVAPPNERKFNTWEPTTSKQKSN